MADRIHEYVVKRLLSAVPVLLIVSFVVVFLIRLIPGGPAIAMLGPSAEPEQIQAVREAMNLDDPLVVQYLNYMIGVVQLDFGTSFVTDRSVRSAILQRFPTTLSVAFGGLVVSLLVAVPAGTIGAVKQDTGYDYAALFFGLVGISIPSFWLGILLIMAFSIYLGWFPVVGYVSPFDAPLKGLRYLVLPSIAIGTAMAAVTTRMLRSSMLDEIRLEYVDAHRMKGLSEVRAVGHAMRNAFIPVITVIGLQMGYLLGGTVVIEEVFTIPGLGRLLVSSIHSRDYIMVQGILLFYTTVFIVVNIVVDVTYQYFNPRITEL